jgi:FkbM family methyltransferase
MNDETPRPSDGPSRRTDSASAAGPGRRELTGRFDACLRYQNAPAWRKPFLNPSRFLRNQLVKYGLRSRTPGTIAKVSAFHMDEFSIVEGELVSQIIGSYGVYEAELTAAFLQIVEPGRVVVDIGMHLGYYATLFAVLTGPQGEVHAFEPTPSTREIGLLNTGKFPQIKVHPLAVWSSAKTVVLRDYGSRWMGFNSLLRAKLSEEPAPPKEIETQAIALDDFRKMLTRPISVIKVDAESAEREIIRGGRTLLKTDQPLISVEVGESDGSSASRDLVEDLEALGYDAWEFVDGRFAKHRKRETYDYSNLIFAPATRDLSRPRPG